MSGISSYKRPGCFGERQVLAQNLKNMEFAGGDGVICLKICRNKMIMGELFAGIIKTAIRPSLQGAAVAQMPPEDTTYVVLAYCSVNIAEVPYIRFPGNFKKSFFVSY